MVPLLAMALLGILNRTPSEQIPEDRHLTSGLGQIGPTEMMCHLVMTGAYPMLVPTVLATIAHSPRRKRHRGTTREETQTGSATEIEIGSGTETTEE